MGKLRYVSTATIEALRGDIAANLARYREGDFLDLVPQNDWSIELPLDVDLTPLEKLDPSGTPAAEIANSRLVWEALGSLSPALACEEGIWVRLTHIECLEYSRARWLNSGMDADQAAKAVSEHFFAGSLTARRDDNAVSRLWWNAFIANLTMPGAGLPALDTFLKKADLRSNFVERSVTASRPVLAAGIVRIMQRNPNVAGREDSFRAFMKSLNRLGGGIVFEAMTEAQIDAFMDTCAASAGIADAKAA